MFDWKKVVSTVAPVLGTALGGPLAGAATKFIADKFLGNPQATEDQIAETVKSASPDQLLQLKKLDQDFAIEMKKLDVDLYKIDADDRASARAREEAVKDKTPAILAYLTILLLVAVTVFFSLNGFTETEKAIEFNFIQLATFVFTYYYGSSNKDRANFYDNKESKSHKLKNMVSICVLIVCCAVFIASIGVAVNTGHMPIFYYTSMMVTNIVGFVIGNFFGVVHCVTELN